MMNKEYWTRYIYENFWDNIRKVVPVMDIYVYEKIMNDKIELPDEIDLYNFFEKWGGKVVGLKEDKAYSKLCRYKTYFTDHSNFDIKDLSSYLAQYDDFIFSNYYIGGNEYHAIKFKDRGTFLVSEKRYEELKAKKGK